MFFKLFDRFSKQSELKYNEKAVLTTWNSLTETPGAFHIEYLEKLLKVDAPDILQAEKPKPAKHEDIVDVFARVYEDNCVSLDKSLFYKNLDGVWKEHKIDVQAL